VTGVIATHGTQLPNRTGIFGGLPGSAARFELVRNCDALAEMANGKAITDLAEVSGDFEELPGVSAGLVIHAGEIVNVRLQNGGGYGDPLLREPAAVQQDLSTGAVSPETARSVYGVVSRDGELDLAATGELRDEIRAQRRERMQAPGVSTASTGLPTTDARWGESLRLHDGRLHCAHCDAELGASGGDWREAAGSIELSAQELGPLVPVHRDLVARMWVCPQCVTSLWVDVLPAQGEAWTDFRLQ
jgi:N-methylhydantoinase B